MPKIRLEPEDLWVGKPVPWPVYATDGTLLLGEGQVVHSERQKRVLVEKGLRPKDELSEKSPPSEEPERSFWSPFEQLADTRDRLRKILLQICYGYEPESDFQGRIYRLARDIQALCTENADAALGALILDQECAYSNAHPILCAIICELVSRRLRLEPDRRLTLAAAALTQNLGMLELQDVLAEQSEPLTVEQRECVNQHPAKGAAMLRSAGISDEAWLEAILMHHERPDGQGYPAGRPADAIPTHICLLSLADMYSAMVLPRRYRDGLQVQRALREIFAQRGKVVDEAMAERLIREIGVYPPGCFVQLANGDIGVVIKRSLKDASHPTVNAVISARGGLYSRPLRRDTHHEDLYAIKTVLPRQESVPMDLPRLWGLAPGM